MGVIIVDVKLAKFEGPIDVVWRSMKKLEAYWELKPDEACDEIEVTDRIIHQRPFIDQRKRKIYLGAIPEVQEAIGLPFEAFDNMNALIGQQNREIREAGRQIQKLDGYKLHIEGMSRWDRFMFFLTGRVY